MPALYWPWPRRLPGVVLAGCHYPLSAAGGGQSGLMLPPELQAAAPPRRAEYLAGRACARRALLALGSDGVPGRAADRAPLWPAGHVGAISHSHGRALAMVAHAGRYQALGVDIEPLFDAQRVAELGDDILSAPERARGDCRHAVALTLAFSLKESLYKALYPQLGRYFDCQDAELLHYDDDGRATLRLLCDLSPRWRRGQCFTGQYGFCHGQLLTMLALPAGCWPQRHGAADADPCPVPV